MSEIDTGARKTDLIGGPGEKPRTGKALFAAIGLASVILMVAWLGLLASGIVWLIRNV